MFTRFLLISIFLLLNLTPSQALLLDESLLPMEGTQYARLYFLGSGVDTYEKPHTDPIVTQVPATCEAKYKYSCTLPYAGLGTPCDGKYATPCVCAKQYNKECFTLNPTWIGSGSSCEGKYEICQCGYSYNQTCTGKYEGDSAVCTLTGTPLYQSCKCKPQYQYTASNCNGDNYPGGDSCTDTAGTRYDNCICNPIQYPHACTDPGQVGVGTQCGVNSGFQKCECETQYQYDDTNCNGDNHTGGNACTDSDGKTTYDECICNPTQYPELCEGTGEKGDGFQCGVNSGFKNCICNASEGYTELCDGEGEDGVGGPCLADGAPKYKSCTCKPTYNKLCNGQGEVGALGTASACTADGGSKYENCTCDPSHQKLCTGPGESGDSVACTADGGHKYSACKCDPSYNRTCDGVGEEGNGPACPTNGKYQSCKCKSTHHYTFAQCNDGTINCGIAPDATTCNATGTPLYNKCTSCCDDSCPTGYSKTDLGGARQTTINDCGNTCYKSCGSGYTWNSGNCASPKALGGSACGGYNTTCSCPSNYNQTCGTDYTPVGTACDGKYTACTCNYSTSTSGCGGGQYCSAYACNNSRCKTCTGCGSSYQYNSSNCSGSYYPGGSECGGYYTNCYSSCTSTCSTYGYYTSVPSGQECSSSTTVCGSTCYYNCATPAPRQDCSAHHTTSCSHLTGEWYLNDRCTDPRESNYGKYYSCRCEGVFCASGKTCSGSSGNFCGDGERCRGNCI